MDKVRFGVIGVGGMGGYHVNYLNSVEGAELTALCDVDKTILERVGKGREVRKFTDYQEMLDSGCVNAIIVATPHYFHCPIARAAFAKGIHVLSEKPQAVSVKDARQTNAAYEKVKDKVKYGIMYQCRTEARHQKMRELIADGEIGQITRITWLATSWFRTWAYYASGGWRATWGGEGGGVLINQCPHNLDLLQWIPGGLMPSRVTAVASIGKTHPIEVEDEVSAILEYPNGAIGHFVTMTGEAPGTDRLEIAGDRGRLVSEGGKLTFVRTRKSVREVNQKSPEMFVHVESWNIDIDCKSGKPEGHKVVTQAFVNGILKGTPLLAEGVDGVRGLEIGNAMLMAGLTRQPVDLPIDGDKFDGFIEDLKKKYGGRKTLGPKADAVSDLNKSFH